MRWDHGDLAVAGYLFGAYAAIMALHGSNYIGQIQTTPDSVFMSQSLPTDVHSLRRAIRSGRRMEFLFFWSHRSRPEAPIGKECLSQWYMAPFVVQGVRYRTAEHYMMAEKARYFGDEATLRQILSVPGPRAAKRLGRQVRHFSEEKWATVRRRIVVAASMAKFSQNPQLAAYLVSTGDHVLVEASPRDPIWGIGLSADDERAKDPLLWPGLNLLGFALMETRDAIVREHSGGTGQTEHT